MIAGVRRHLLGQRPLTLAELLHGPFQSLELSFRALGVLPCRAYPRPGGNVLRHGRPRGGCTTGLVALLDVLIDPAREMADPARSEERRVGKESRPRWS